MTNNDIIAGFDNDAEESLRIQLQKPEQAEACLIIVLDGYIDTYNSEYFQKKITQVVENGYINLVFDCARLNYVSSTGIGAFTTFLRVIKAKAGALVMVGVESKVLEVFQLLGFAQFFNIKDSLDEALTLLKNSHAGEDTEIFPVVFECPVCSKKLKANQAGRFRCSECKVILVVDNTGKVFLS